MPARSLSTKRSPGRAYAARRLEVLGVSEQSLRGANDIEALVHELDRFYALGFGTATQRRFLHMVHPDLDGNAPVAIMRRKDGTRVVRKALRSTLDKAFAAKLGA